MRKYLFYFMLTVLVSPAAMADSQAQAIQDGMSITAMQNALSSNINGSNLKITDYSKSWVAYIPMRLIISPNLSYRNISFEFTDRQGKKQKFSCKASTQKTDNDFFVYDCANSDPRGIALRYFSSLFQYGYTEDSIIMEDLVTRPAARQPNPAGAVR
jgi:hypothetical protein